MQKILFDTYEYNDKCRFVLGNNGKNPLICIGINPSNATNQRSDKTIAKIQKIIQYNGYDGFMMINLCSKISPYPKDIPYKLADCYHNDNLRHIENVSKKYPNSDVLACWGNSFYMREYLPQILLDIVNKLGKHRKWFYLKDLTKKGNPRHPLARYIPFNSELKIFDIHSYIAKNQYVKSLSCHTK